MTPKLPRNFGGDDPDTWLGAVERGFVFNCPTAGHLAASVLRRCVKSYHELEKFRDSAFSASQAAGGDERWDRWTDRATCLFGDARRALITTILMAHGLVEEDCWPPELDGDWEGVVVDLDGTLYVVAPEDDDAARPILTVVKGERFKTYQDGDISDDDA